MNAFTRLVEAGIRPDCAIETVAWYREQGDEQGLARYVEEVEEKIRRLEKKERANCGL